MPAHTASTIVTEVVSGSHVLTVQGYSHTIGHGVGECIQSASFTVGGHSWVMAYFPDGFRLSRSDCISIGIIMLRHTDATIVKARCKFSLLDHLGKPVPEYTKPYRNRTCVAQGDGTVSTTFIRRSVLENSPYLRDDCFSARCEVDLTNIRTEDATAPPSSMPEQLGRILDTGEATDVTFEVGGETFAAHWCLLAARSSMFMAQFLSDATTSVPIKDMEPTVFKAMLHFIYTDSLPKIDDDNDDETVRMLFAAAERYNLDKLKMICESILCNNISTSTAAAALAFAKQHGCLALKKACFQFLASLQNLMAIVGSDAFENLKSTEPNILEDLVANVDDTPPDNTDATNVEVSCRFSLLDQLGEPVPEYTTAEGHITEFPRFIKREELENSTYLKDDCFSIRCDVSVSKGIRAQPTTQLVTVPPPDMLHQFGRMLETGVGADVTFEIGGEMFAAHRRLLAARSSVFMAQLFGPTKENDATLIQINDMEPKVFKMMLHFIYTDTLPSIDDGVIMEMAQHLFVVAGRYNLERLKLICTNMLCDHINSITVALMLAFAEQYGCDGLKKACFKFQASSQNLKTATRSDGLQII
ncbi:BTB/POZ and MATH domain-containing protein 2-like [Lolium perenne]|uniref:BTB/POZ and MATH domain-containing protein 2-like n=1 Tax=Lolium perenne TaxID=4522 RepID=UPI0021F5B6EB|nr:BTB/POZ and MATH domain-containing protein 2-like [Lolium perenne]